MKSAAIDVGSNSQLAPNLEEVTDFVEHFAASFSLTKADLLNTKGLNCFAFSSDGSGLFLNGFSGRRAANSAFCQGGGFP